MFVFAKKGVKFYQKLNISMDVVPSGRPQIARIPLAALGDDEMFLNIKINNLVYRYQCIASSKEKGLYIYSPYSGKFIGTEICKIPRLGKVPCAVIETVEEKPHTPSFEEDISKPDLNSLINIVKKAGIIDEFDGIRLFKKLELLDENTPALVVDGVDEQPFMSAATSVLQSFGNEISAGINVLANAMNCQNKYLLTKKNFQTAKLFKGNFFGTGSDKTDIKMVAVRGKYPASPATQTFVKNISGFRIGIQAVRALYRAVAFSIPHTSTVVTVWGEGLKEPANIEVPFGTPAARLLEQCGASGTIERIVAGGIMTGKTISPTSPLCIPITSVTVMLPSSEKETENCICCGRCIAVCPADLAPFYVRDAIKNEDTDRMLALNATSCIGCGCCSYICPASQPITEMMKYARKKAINYERETAKNA